MKHLYIIDETSRAANYGIGTYIREVTSALSRISIRITVVCLHAVGHDETIVEEVEGVRHINIVSRSSIRGNTTPLLIKQRQLRNIFYVLLPFISENDENIFHFNYTNAKELALLLKKRFDCKVILTVHYMNWCFTLKGDSVKLRKIIEQPKDENEEITKKSFEMEKDFMNMCCDRIIAISHHSFQTLHTLYAIPLSNLSLIQNGLDDCYIKYTKHEKKEIRSYYHFPQKEAIVMFAGRLDTDKGIYFLLKAIRQLIEKGQKIHLLLAGDGDFGQCLKEISPYWHAVTFTGFIDKKELYKLYSIADIGIVPSAHEEFGYVALEMIMNGLPVIVNGRSGLSEIVEEDYNGLYVSLTKETADEERLSVDALAEKISCLLTNNMLRKQFRKNGRLRFKERYSREVFVEKMLNFYATV